MIRTSAAFVAALFLAGVLAGCSAGTARREAPAVSASVPSPAAPGSADSPLEPPPTAPVDPSVAARQIGGGDLAGHPELLAYVQRVGSRIARAAGAHGPQRFTIIDNSVPNAWALPGGGVAVTRGLLVGLHCEAELAAVVAHQLAHAPPQPASAVSGEQPVALPGSVLGVLRSGVRDNRYVQAVVGEATAVAGEVAARFGSEDELAADRAALRSLAKAGYDASVVADLQRVFLELDGAAGEGWRAGLFARHPPSAERLRAASRVASRARRDGRACERYDSATGRLRQLQPAFAAYDAGVAALRAGDLDGAAAKARDAIAIDPGEAKFHELLGDVALSRGEPLEASLYYDRAAALNPAYFKPHLAAGIASFVAGRPDVARERLERSMTLLPTADAAYWLGRVAQASGDRGAAVERFRLAATSDSDVGRAAARELLAIDGRLRADALPPPERR